MPVPDGKGLEGCKEACSKKAECDAIEYAGMVSTGTECCKLVNCNGTVPEPMMTQAPHHGGNWTYKGYVKGNFKLAMKNYLSVYYKTYSF